MLISRGRRPDVAVYRSGVERCTECGFEYDLSTALSAGPAIADGVAALVSLALQPGTDLRARRRPHVWSPLEYLCHLRDVLLVQRERVLLARRVDRPALEPMGRDERVDHDGYGGQDPVDVARQLTDAAHLFANVITRLTPDDWERTVIYNYPERAERPLRWVCVHTAHEVQHHLLDVRRQVQ
jgi:hypothetical protein